MNAAGRDPKGVCDRRLSRAARSLVEEGLRGMVPTADDASLEQMLAYLGVPSDKVDTAACPLRGVGDWHAEPHVGTVQMPITPSTSASLPGGGLTTTLVGRLVQGDAQVYECLLCGKLFSSRYYLDRHQETQHDQQSADQMTMDSTAAIAQTLMCPATDWCSFLAPTACHDRALRDEPFYGRGSSGRRSDRYERERQLWKQAHAVTCTTTSLAHARTACQDVAQTCFGESTTRVHWESHMCGAPLAACPHPLQRWTLLRTTHANGDLTFRQFHEWQADWQYWSSEHHAVGWTGGLLLTALVVYYARLGWQTRRHRQRRTRAPRLWRASRRAKAKVH
jgi:hypothetical protein